ncbi:PleD family two-component system response regulator [Candidatus Omnitrophota bacterium]
MIKKKILLIDDDQEFLELVALHLKKTEKYEVGIETNAIQAVAVALEFKPDLILLDINMPLMDGGEVASQIRSQNDLKDIPLVFLTSLIRKEETASRDKYLDKKNFFEKLRHKEELIDYIEGLLLYKNK